MFLYVFLYHKIQYTDLLQPLLEYNSRKGPVIKYGGGGGGLWKFFLSTGFQWPTPELFDKIGAAHPWSGTEKTSDPPPNQNQ